MSDRNLTRRDACTLIALGGLGLLSPAACTFAQTKPESSKPDETLEQRVERIRKAHNLPSLAAAIVREGKIVASVAVGVRQVGSAEKITIDDPFHIASCTKSMSATLAAIAVHRGLLKWTTTIADGLPTIASRIRPEYRSATLEQVLAHAAKMPAYTQPSAAQVEWMRSLKGTSSEQRLAFLLEVLKTEDPNHGSGNAGYSNVGYAAVGAMVEKAMGAIWEDLIRREIATPLRINSLGFGYPATAANPDRIRGHAEANGNIVELPLDPTRQLAICLWPAGAVHCSIRDLALYAADHLNGLLGRRALLPKSIYQHLHRPPGGGRNGFSLGWGIAQDDRWGTIHFGAGSGGWFFVRIVIVPTRDAAIVVASNSGSAASATRELYMGLLEGIATQ